MNNYEINNRLNKIEGQIIGLSKMVQVEEESALSIIQQILAIKNALEKVGVLILIEELKRKREEQNCCKIEKIFDYLIKLS